MNWIYEEGRIYSLDEKNELLAETTYVLKENGEIDIDDTYVSPSLRGKGAAGKMMEVVCEYIRKKELKTTASCAYANAWLKKHQDIYSDIISKDIDEGPIACKIGGRH